MREQTALSSLYPKPNRSPGHARAEPAFQDSGQEEITRQAPALSHGGRDRAIELAFGLLFLAPSGDWRIDQARRSLNSVLDLDGRLRGIAEATGYLEATRSPEKSRTKS